MKRNRESNLEIGLGLFFALVLVALFVLMEVAGGLTFFSDTVSVKARFSNIRDLKGGDPVKMAGVEIGQVESIGFDNNEVLVTMQLDDDKAAAVTTDSVASIQFMGLMGQNYIAIEFGKIGSKPIDSGNFINTREQPDFSHLMSQIDGVADGIRQVTDTFGGEKITDILAPLADFLKENKDKVSSIIANVQTSTAQISQGEGTIGRLINDDELYQTAVATVEKLNKTSETLDLAIADAQAAIKDLRAGKGTLGKLATDEALFEETKLAMTNLRQILEKINRGEGSVGNPVNDASLIDNAKATLQKVEKATEGLEDQGPLSVIGLAVGRLF